MPATHEPDGLWRLLTAILLFRARQLSFFKTVGGIYFRSSLSEELFTVILNSFILKLDEKLQRDDFRRATDLMDPEGEVTASMMKMRSGVPLKWSIEPDAAKQRALFDDVYKRLEEWLLQSPVEFRQYCRLIQVAGAILSFECDRPFYQTEPLKLNETAQADAQKQNSGWYFDPPQLSLQKAMYSFPEPLRKDLCAQITRYAKGVPKECMAGSDFELPPAPA